MKRFLLLTSIFLLFLYGCSNPNENELGDKKSNVDFELVASEKSLPANFHEVASKREKVPYFSYLVKRAENQNEFKGIWNFYQLSNKMPKVNLDENHLLFIGVEESGSCPSKLGAVNLNSDKQELNIYLLGQEGNCTADATPRTFVIQIDKEKLTNLKSMVMVESGVETAVPIEGNIDK
jgi:hypothetical protein